MKKDTNSKSKTVIRTSAGLREALFDEIDGLRSGDSNPTRANAVAKLSDQIVNTVSMEIMVQRFASKADSLGTIETKSLPKPISLVG